MAPKTVVNGYVKTDSRNLLKLSFWMVVEFFNSLLKLEPEVQHAKRIKIVLSSIIGSSDK